MTHAGNPLTNKELAALNDDEGYFTVTTDVGLDEIVDLDLEGLLDLFDSQIAAEGILSDINYKIDSVVDEYTIRFSVTAHNETEDEEDYEEGEEEENI